MKLKDYTPLLKNINLFRDLTNNDFDKLFTPENHSIVSYPKRSIIYFQHEKCNSFDIILEGNVLIQNLDENGNILTVTSFSIGDSLGGNLILSDNNTYPMGVVAKDFTILLKLNRELVLSLCQRNKNFLMEFIKGISNRSYMLGTKLRTMTLKTIREQIIDFLIYQYHSQNTLKIKLGMTKREWSEKLGVHRPSLSRELSRMKSEGLIDYDRDYIIIKKPLLRTALKE